MLNLGKIEGILRNLEAYTRYLSRLGQLSQEEFLADPIAIGAAKYYLLASIECCLDIANHIISRKRFRSPQDYADAFQVLREEDILNETFAQRLQQMARFRNLLVHQYAEIDDAQVYRTLQDDLNDFDIFVQKVTTYLGV